MTLTLRDRLIQFALANRAQIRLACLFLAFWLVWAQASNVSQFFTGFFDGMSGR
jgi:hypothetical protein